MNYKEKQKVNRVVCPVRWAEKMGNKDQEKMNYYGETLHLWKRQEPIPPNW